MLITINNVQMHNKCTKRWNHYIKKNYPTKEIIEASVIRWLRLQLRSLRHQIIEASDQILYSNIIGWNITKKTENLVSFWLLLEYFWSWGTSDHLGIRSLRNQIIEAPGISSFILQWHYWWKYNKKKWKPYVILILVRVCLKLRNIAHFEWSMAVMSLWQQSSQSYLWFLSWHMLLSFQNRCLLLEDVN